MDWVGTMYGLAVYVLIRKGNDCCRTVENDVVVVRDCSKDEVEEE